MTNARSEESGEIVNFPVPRQFLPVVVGSLADAMRGIQPPSTPLSMTTFDEPNGWTKEEIQQLKKASLLSPTAKVLLDLTAERAGEWVDYDEICSRAERTPRQAQGELAGFTQLLKRHFGKEGQGGWPVEVKWKNSQEEQTRYRMPTFIARWWNLEKVNVTVDDLKKGLTFELDQSSDQALNVETAAAVLNYFYDQVLGKVMTTPESPASEDDYFRIRNAHRDHLERETLYHSLVFEEVDTADVNVVKSSNGTEFLADKDFKTSADFLTCLKKYQKGLVITIRGSRMQLHLADCGHFKGADQLEWVRNGTLKGVSLNRGVLTEHGLLKPDSAMVEWVRQNFGRDLTEKDWCRDCRQRWAKGA